ncbi:biotin synthase [Vibrio phage qdvp001]|uniref:biotin synthase n=1 Tax=Vibrio phage qdvp001 TaxID=1003177 RepID=UPI000721B60A|nr:biotin synthase [Vibrio phage qdvp001]ALM62134.1 biotin synthase [Vibrio phage qdvp001]
MKELYYKGTILRGGKSFLREYEVFKEGDKLEWGLTKGQYTIVDIEDFDYLLPVTWRAVEATNVTGWYVSGGGTNKQSSFKMHQYLAGIHRKQTDIEVDHKNRNSLDNSKKNLRLANRFQQQLNLTRERYSTSNCKGLCGVRLNRTKTKYQAWYTDSSNNWRNVGMFDCIISAAKARDEAVYEHFKYHDPLKGLELRGITSEPTLNFLYFNFPERLHLN